MTSRTTASPDTAVRLCCWSMAGHDAARPQCASIAWKRPSNILGLVVSMLVWWSIGPSPLMRGVDARFTGPLLHAQCQPIPHSTR